MRKCCAGSKEHRLSVKIILERHKQVGTVLMKGRTTVQVADDRACRCRQVPAEVWCLDDQRRCSHVVYMRYSVSQRRADMSET